MGRVLKGHTADNYGLFGDICLNSFRDLLYKAH